MQFYARFQDEVVSEPAAIAAHVERARTQTSPAFRTIFDEKLVAAHERLVANPAPIAAHVERAREQVSPAFRTIFDEKLLAAHQRLVEHPGDVSAKVAFVTIYHLILESTLGLTTFEFSTRFMEREGLLAGFLAGYTKIHHDEHRHIGYGVWYLRQAVARTPAMGDVIRATLRDLLPAVAESLQAPEGADISVLGASTEDLRRFALDGLTRRLGIIGVPIDTL